MLVETPENVIFSSYKLFQIASKEVSKSDKQISDQLRKHLFKAVLTVEYRLFFLTNFFLSSDTFRKRFMKKVREMNSC